MPQPTTYPHINALLAGLVTQLQSSLVDKLVGVYLYGSLVMGDFDEETSDIDLLVALTDDLTQADFDALDALHKQFAVNNPRWEGRLEIAYLSLNALQTFKTQTSKIGIISPGEPFHIVEAGRDWLVNWHIVREYGVVLVGPPPAEIIAPTTKAEFVQIVREHVDSWREWITHMEHRPGQAYAILTMCRAYYTVTHGEQTTKLEAAAWAAEQLPEWALVINNAVKRRKAWRDQDVDHAATLPETRQFATFMIDHIISEHL
jgi:hypothetical protein